MITKEHFFPKIYPTDLSPEKTWYINYYDSVSNKRIRYYGGLNRIKDIDERTQKAKELCVLLQNDNFIKKSTAEKKDFFNNGGFKL